MKLYINGRFLTQPMTGVERYAYNICKALARLQQPFTLVCPKAPIHQDYDVSDLTILATKGVARQENVNFPPSIRVIEDVTGNSKYVNYNIALRR